MTRPKKLLNLGLIAIYHFFIWALGAAPMTAAPLHWRVEAPLPCLFSSTFHTAEPRRSTIPVTVLTASDGCASFHPAIALTPALPVDRAARMFHPATPDLQGVVAPVLGLRCGPRAPSSPFPKGQLRIGASEGIQNIAEATNPPAAAASTSGRIRPTGYFCQVRFW
jgi:hypothetical protein